MFYQCFGLFEIWRRLNYMPVLSLTVLIFFGMSNLFSGFHSRLAGANFLAWLGNLCLLLVLPNGKKGKKCIKIFAAAKAYLLTLWSSGCTLRWGDKIAVVGKESTSIDRKIRILGLEYYMHVIFSIFSINLIKKKVRVLEKIY